MPPKRSTKAKGSKSTRKTRPIEVDVAKTIERGSDNKLQVPKKGQQLKARRQTPVALANIRAFDDEPEQTRIQSAKSQLGGNSRNSIASTISTGVAVENGHKPFSIGTSTSERKSVAKRKRQNLMPTPTSGRTATQSSPMLSASGETPRKRCCKSDLKRCLRVGDILENNRVEETILRERNNGHKLLARFDGENFIDCDTGEKYNSLTSWVKGRMIELQALSSNSNISGWDYAIVRRNENGFERTIAIRQLVEDTKKKQQTLQAGVNLKLDAPILSSGNTFIGSVPFSADPNFHLRNSGTLSLPPKGSKMMLQEKLMLARQQVSQLEQQLYSEAE